MVISYCSQRPDQAHGMRPPPLTHNVNILVGATADILLTLTCLQVDDQMKLLQHSWSDMLVLDHMHQRMHNSLPDETTLPNGQKFDLLCLGLLGVPALADSFAELTAKLAELKFDVSDYVCVKFLLLLNPGQYTRIVYLSTLHKLACNHNKKQICQQYLLAVLTGFKFEDVSCRKII